MTVCYMAQNEGSPIYKSDLAMVTRKDDPAAAPFDAYEATEATEEKLWSELLNPSWNRRYAAHVELFRRELRRRPRRSASRIVHPDRVSMESRLSKRRSLTSWTP